MSIEDDFKCISMKARPFTFNTIPTTGNVGKTSLKFWSKMQIIECTTLFTGSHPSILKLFLEKWFGRF